MTGGSRAALEGAPREQGGAARARGLMYLILYNQMSYCHVLRWTEMGKAECAAMLRYLSYPHVKNVVPQLSRISLYVVFYKA